MYLRLLALVMMPFCLRAMKVSAALPAAASKQEIPINSGNIATSSFDYQKNKKWLVDLRRPIQYEDRPCLYKTIAYKRADNPLFSKK